jgi:hypothetical protein
MNEDEKVKYLHFQEIIEGVKPYSLLDWQELQREIKSVLSLLSSREKTIGEKEEKIRELEADLKLNASMLTKQTDLAREAETERERLSKLLIDARISIIGLLERISSLVVGIKDFLDEYAWTKEYWLSYRKLESLIKK